MKALDQPFTKIINGTTQFVIPVFQRDYSWSEAECEQLWKDVVHVAQHPDGRRHFLGSVVYVPTGDSAAGFTRWLLIDGQQRLTTLTLLLTALRDHIHETGWEGTEDDPTVTRVEAYFLKNLQEEGKRRYKLVLRRTDNETLQALIDKTDPPTEASERILENYDYFSEQLKEADLAEVYRGIGRLVVVDVTLDRADDPQLIFESLNSTGVDLSQSDLIRNFILMRLSEREQTRLYETYWSKIESLFRGSERAFDAFARDYLALKTQASKQEKASEIYLAFRRAFPDLESALGGLEAVLSDMQRFAAYHAAFSLGRHAPPTLEAQLAHLRRLVDVPAILIMRLFDCYDRLGTLSDSDFGEALELLESYIFRRAICGEQTRGYWQVFASLAYQVDGEEPLTSLKVGLARQRENYRFPSNIDFQRELLERDLYALRVCSHLLDRLENHGSKEPTDTSKYTIEHIMPQNTNLSSSWRKMLGKDWKEIQKRWLHRLGNLTLTGYNSTYSDRSFGDKKSLRGGFEESSVRLNKFVREQNQWTPKEMEKRGTLLAERALNVWPPLTVDQSLVEAAAHREMQQLATRRDVSKVNMAPKPRKLFEHLREHVLELGGDILEIAESKSVSYHGPSFFLEVLPRKNRLVLLLPLDFNEVDDPEEIALDATNRKFFFYAKYEGGVWIRIRDVDDVEPAISIIRQAYLVTCA